jgi:hypothetical protein
VDSGECPIQPSATLPSRFADEQVIQIEGDPDSPVSRGRLCPKGAASNQWVVEARQRGQGDPRRPALHPHQRPGRPALPIRAGTDIVFLAQREAKGIEQ